MTQTKRTHYARTADSDRPVLDRRMTWQEFWAMRPDRRPGE